MQVSLSRAQIVDAAYGILRQHGLAGLSMRRLAQDLGVQPGALYYYVASKQDLLAAVAERVLGGITAAPAADPGQLACDIREALLHVRDSAEVVSFVHAFKPDSLAPFRDLRRLFAARLPPPRAGWAAQTLVHYVLGFVADEQNHAELLRAGITAGEPDPAESRDAFLFGVSAILRGLAPPGT